MSGDGAQGSGRLVTGVAWAVLLLGLWLWGRGTAGGPGASSAPTTGDVAAVGRPPGVPLPPAHAPVEPARPDRVDIPSLGVAAAVVVPRGLDAAGAIDPPPYSMARTVGWYGSGTQPGARGASLLVGHVDTETRPAVFYGLSAARPGEKVRVTRTDGSVAEFTIDDVQVFGRDRFDARKAYGPRRAGRAELRLITCGGTFDRAAGSYTANVVVSAYLTKVSRATPVTPR
ncbi:class F sortase [Streptomyces katsurahamanus]|uniref:Class F sortase n=1 Tax=Streptomyces katsurahamanus TaxID=2577098 RepID=A0ABW9NX95_9ACTN|nr:class F sortase [Streptomyces katsurahamanus]MQS37956.1 class F sortase [Streptomyces katsurahamanus]